MDDDVSIVEALASLLEQRINLAAQTEPRPHHSDTGMKAALARLAAERQRREGAITCFDAVELPDVSLRGYLVGRLHKHAGCSGACYVLAAAYIDRFMTSHKTAFTLSAINVHRLVLVTVVVAAKFLDDNRCLNSYYASLGGLTLEELNYLEVQFLQFLGWNIFVSTEQFETYYRALVPKQIVDPPCDGDADYHTSLSRVCDDRRAEWKAKASRRLKSLHRRNSTGITSVSCGKIMSTRIKDVVRGMPMSNHSTSASDRFMCQKYSKRPRRTRMSRMILRMILHAEQVETRLVV